MKALAYADTLYSNSTTVTFDPDTDLASLKQTFVDEFDKLSMQSDGGTWRPSFNADGSMRSLYTNGEEQIYMDPAYKGLGVQPLTVSNGVLNIHAAPSSAAVEAATGYDYTSGMISSKSAFAQTYGYFEIKCQLPDEKGAWPAFWLLPADSSWPPELDVFEVLGHDPTKVYTTVHTNVGGVHTGEGKGTVVSDLSVGMHTYGVLWTKSDLVWFVDGEEVFRAATPADMNKPMYMIANLAIGGYWPGHPDANFTSADMKIDYIKAYSLDGWKPGTDPATGNGAGDVFIVSKASDIVKDTVLGDGDLVKAGISYVLPEHVENLTLTGTQNLNGTGNAQDNILVGNSGSNVLIGLDGDDVLKGLGGSDTLIGGSGDDTYYVESSGDRVVELAGGGTDTVHSAIAYSLTSNVENLILDGSAARGIGNALDNVLTGNAASNYLSGGDGADTLIGNGGDDCLSGGSGADLMQGGTGNDTYSVDNVGDRVLEAANAGVDTVNAGVSFTLSDNVERLTLVGSGSINGIGNGLDNMITGNGGNNLLNGGAGDDTLISNGGKDVFIGGMGSDTFVFNASGALRIDDFGSGGQDRLIIGSAVKGAATYSVYTDTGGSAHVHFADGSDILLKGVKAADLHISGNVITA